MKRRVFEIVAPGKGRVVEEALPTPADHEILVRATAGAVSPGSEALVFSGNAGATTDTALNAALGGGYPLRYGYTLVGEVVSRARGSRAGGTTPRQRVFCFHPHATHAVVPHAAALAIPDGIPTEFAPLYPNTETALTLLWDGAPRLGEAVAVLGGGIVGILLAMVLTVSGVGLVVLIEPRSARRRQAETALAGVERAALVADVAQARDTLGGYRGAARHETYRGFDLIYEVSGNPAALDDAVRLATFEGRVVVGSWYGERRHPVALDDRFHRARISLRSSQVSTIASELAGRIDRVRRTALVWDTMGRMPLAAIPRREVSLAELGATLAAVGRGEVAEPWIAIDYERSSR